MTNPDDEVTLVGPGDVTLKCAKCSGSIARASLPPHEWVHRDDTVSLKTLISDYDHEAVPDFIEVGLVDEQPETKKSVKRSGNRPFDVLSLPRNPDRP